MAANPKAVALGGNFRDESADDLMQVTLVGGNTNAPSIMIREDAR